MSKSKIEWTELTWNPVRGCSKISAGCENCYAMHVAARFSLPGQPYEGVAKRDPINWTGKLELIEAKLCEPLRRRKPTVYFVNSMSDLFHENLPFELIDRVFAVMALCPQHTFQVLTKRADRMAEYFADQEAGQMTRTIGRSRRERVYTAAADLFEDRDDASADVYVRWLTEDDSPWPLPNVWLGVSCENQGTADERIPHLLNTPVAVRFLSCEPLLGPIDLREWLHDSNCLMKSEGRCNCCQPREVAPDWIIVGGESAQRGKVRWCDLAWIESIVGQCQAADVPVFVKQLGSTAYRESYGGQLLRLEQRSRKGGDPGEWPQQLRVRQFPKRRLAAV